MRAIYKKELKSYFSSMIGFIFIGFFLAIVGIYTVALNMVNGYSNFEYVLSSLSFILIILVPILTMRVMAEEKRQKTEQLLYTAPISVEKIVIGKYLAVLTLFLISMGVTLCYPLILNQFGSVNFASAYAGILGFTLMGAAYIALGIFISSLTESQVIAAVVSFLVFLLTDLMPSVSNLLPNDTISSLLVLSAIVLIASWVVYFMTRSAKTSIILALLGSAALVGVYILKTDLFNGLLVKLCNSVAIMTRFDNFLAGILDMSAICYFLSIIVFFLFLTIALIKHSFTPRQLKSGIYKTAVMAAVMVIAVMLNLTIGQMDIKLDLSADSMYTLTEETNKLADGLKEDISIYYIVQEGNQTTQIETIVKQYQGLGKRIRVVQKDPIQNPSFTKDYTDQEVEEESIIVVNETTQISKYIPYSDMLISDYDASYQSYISAIDVEGQITSAVSYVTSENLPKMYVVSGHGEGEIGTTLETSIRKLNITVENLQTLSEEVIPEDCALLLVNAPTNDLSENETAMIKSYLEDGGKAILNTGYTGEDMKNYDSLFESYGLNPTEGLVIEGSGNYIANYPSYLIPQTMSHEITDSVENYIVTAAAQGFDLTTDMRSTLTEEDLLVTTDQAFSRVDFNEESLTKKDGEKGGPFVLGAAITEQIGEKETKIAAFSSSYLLDETFLSSGQFGNKTLFLNAVTWLVDMENGLSIPSRSVSQTYLSVTPSQAVFFGILLVFVLPLSIFITGLVIWIRRRKN